jgi:hypothetical protein
VPELLIEDGLGINFEKLLSRLIEKANAPGAVDSETRLGKRVQKTFGELAEYAPGQG